MPRRAKAKGIYQRGPYWLDWDRRGDGSLRSPYLAIFWYDAERGRIRSASTRAGDVPPAKAALDRHYLQTTEGAAICPTCGQRRHSGTGFLVTRAISDYLTTKDDAASIGAIRPRLNHVLRYIATLPDAAVRCEQVNEAWIARFRKWLVAEPVVSTAGNARDAARSAGTVENSVVQLAAAINAAHSRGDAQRPAQFRAIPLKELTRTPRRRLSIDELAAAFRYAIDPRYPTKRQGLHRFLMISVATACRPDAAHDFSTDRERDQWIPEKRVIALNQRGRRQTKKYRATVIAPYQIKPYLEAAKGMFVPAASVRSAFESMCDDLGWPRDGENGLKLIRRSIAQLLRDPARKVPSEQLELQLGHRRLDSVTDLYAAFDPAYLNAATRAIEAVIDEIEARAPGAFHRSRTGNTPSIVPISAARRAGK